MLKSKSVRAEIIHVTHWRCDHVTTSTALSWKSSPTTAATTTVEMAAITARATASATTITTVEVATTTARATVTTITRFEMATTTAAATTIATTVTATTTA